MFDRCTTIVTQQLAGRLAVANGQHVEPEPEREFIICSLDVISGAQADKVICKRGCIYCAWHAGNLLANAKQAVFTVRKATSRSTCCNAEVQYAKAVNIMSNISMHVCISWTALHKMYAVWSHQVVSVEGSYSGQELLQINVDDVTQPFVVTCLLQFGMDSDILSCNRL